MRIADEWVEVREHAPLGQPARLVYRSPRITAQDLQWLRERLMFAFLAPGDYREDRPPPVRAAAWDTTTTRDAFPRDRAQQLGTCPIDDGESRRLPFDYVASLARDTTRVTVTETRPKKSSAIPLAPSAFEDARLIRAVSALDPEHRHWLRYAYAESSWEDEAGAVVALWARVRPALGKLQGKTEAKLKGLAHLAIQHGRRLANCGQELHAPARLRELLGVSEANFDQHWRPRWKALLAGVEQLDAEGLQKVLLVYQEEERHVRMDKKAPAGAQGTQRVLRHRAPPAAVRSVSPGIS